MRNIGSTPMSDGGLCIAHAIANTQGRSPTLMPFVEQRSPFPLDPRADRDLGCHAKTRFLPRWDFRLTFALTVLSNRLRSRMQGRHQLE